MFVASLLIALYVLILVAVGWSTQRLLRKRSRLVSYGAAIAAPFALALVSAILLDVIGSEIRETFNNVSQAPPPLAPPLPAPVPDAYVRAQMAREILGLIEFNPSPEMRVGQPERVTVRISRSKTEDVIKRNLQGRGLPQIEELKVGNFMKVRLFGDGFKVTTHSDENQVVPGEGFAEWLFTVLPVSSGSEILDLLVTIRYKLPQRDDEVIDLPVFTRKVSVQVNVWWSFSDFMSDNWKWFLSGLGGVLVAIGGYFGKRWLERPKPPHRRRG